MVSKAHVLSANKPDFRDIMTLQASGVPKDSRQKSNLEPHSYSSAVNHKKI